MSLTSKPAPQPAGDDRQEDRRAVDQPVGVERRSSRPTTSRRASSPRSPSSSTRTPLVDAARSTVGSRSSPTSRSSSRPRVTTVTTFLLNDYNYPLVSQTYRGARRRRSRDKRDELKALLKAEIMGWRGLAQGPDRSAPTLAVEQVRQDARSSTLNTQIAQSKAQNKLILDSRTKTEGIFTVPHGRCRRPRSRPCPGRHRPSPPTSCSTCRCSTEVYQENPDLDVRPDRVTGTT